MKNFIYDGWDLFSELKREEILYKLNFIQGVRLKDDGRTLGIDYRIADQEHVVKRIGEIFEEAESSKDKDKIIFVSQRRESRFKDNIFDELVNDGQIGVYRDGLVSLDQDVSTLMDYFDHRFNELAELFGAEHHTYPTLIPTEILERCNYFQSFPQYVNLVTHLDENNELYKSFGDDFARRSEGGFQHDKYFKKIECALSPAVCFHCYHKFEDAKLEAGKGKVVAAKGKCFRYESGNMRTLERLWDFTMREIIFIGSLRHVTDKRKESIRFISQMVDELGLCGHIEVASDPFFTNSMEKRTYQLGFELKFELRLEIPFERKTIAVGSFNLHEDFFGKTFRISTGDEGDAFTGCTAFGIERWVYAFLAQYGSDKKHWPEQVRDYVAARSGKQNG